MKQVTPRIASAHSPLQHPDEKHSPASIPQELHAPTNGLRHALRARRIIRELLGTRLRQEYAQKIARTGYLIGKPMPEEVLRRVYAEHLQKQATVRLRKPAGRRGRLVKRAVPQAAALPADNRNACNEGCPPPHPALVN